jgi:hypothetical protein
MDVFAAGARRRRVSRALPGSVARPRRPCDTRALPGRVVDKALSASYSDLLYRVQVSSKPGFLYVLFEHQSSPGEVMPLRLLGYVVRILELWLREQRDRGEAVLPLPVVIPVVLHHSESGWTRAARFEELFDPELVAEPAIAALVPRFEFLLDDLSRTSDEALRQRALDQVTSLTLWALRDGWLGAIRELRRTAHGLEAFGVVFRYISLVTERPAAERVIDIVLAEAPAGTKEAMGTLAEHWIAEGEAKGEVRGREEGRRDTLLRLLTLKFGELPPEQRARILNAHDADLVRWTDRILTAESVSAMFAD